MQTAICLTSNLWGNFKQCIYIWYLFKIFKLQDTIVGNQIVIFWKIHFLLASLLRVKGREETSEVTDEQNKPGLGKGPENICLVFFFW